MQHAHHTQNLQNFIITPTRNRHIVASSAANTVRLGYKDSQVGVQSQATI